ncbi:MAG: protein-glutamate O-methyltransferase CheR [Deltaproteobacteria bacterium]|nr:protein-glutamate O-methyltransferase CheR [Deltaproteobacteria bacterium]
MSVLVSSSAVERLREEVARVLGLQFDDSKLDLLADVLTRRADAFKSSVETYLEGLTRAEWSHLAEELTVNETYFFRNPDHFRVFSERVLPEALRKRDNPRRLRILSAGCATGEEPYSLAALTLESVTPGFELGVSILGIDVNPSVLNRARQGRYSAWSLRATDELSQRRWFRQDGREFVLDRSVRERVTFEVRNLVDDDSMFWADGAFDVIFCRNVIMYFTPEAARQVVRRLSRALRPAGYLFLGHAETLRGVNQDFHLCHSHETFYYQRRSSRLDSDGSQTEPERVVPRIELTTSWVEAIQKASDKITALADHLAGPESSTEAPTTASLRRVRPESANGMGLVFEAMRQERFVDALDLLAGLPLEVGDEPDVLLVRAVLLTNAGRLVEAEAVGLRLLAHDELNSGAHYAVALCREHAADLEGAIEHDETAIYLDQGFAMPHLHLGMLYRRLGDFGRARRELELALALLHREDSARVLLFGGGFSREALLEVCRAALAAGPIGEAR